MPLLKIVVEREALEQAADLTAFRNAATGLDQWVEIDPPGHAPAELVRAAFAGAAAGAPPPAWARQNASVAIGETVICRANGACWWPKYGVVATAEGQVFASTAAEARARTADLTALRGLATSSDGVVFSPPPNLPAVGPTAVFLPFGARANYGHFLLDALPGLLMMEEAGLLERFTPSAPELKGWQRELLALAFPDLTVHRCRGDLYRAESLVFPTALDHFLQRPSPVMNRLRARMVKRLALTPGSANGRRLYLSRRKLSQRLMLNEAVLEAALAQRGFDILSPQTLTPRRQAELCAQAEVIVAPVGAALANALFAPPGCKVIEIVPQGFGAPWVASLCQTIGAKWGGFFCGPPAAADDAPLSAQLRWLPRRLTRRYHMAYETPLEAFLAFLDARL